MKCIAYIALSFTLVLCCVHVNYAQSYKQNKVIQLYGVIHSSDSGVALPGASIFVRGTRRGTISNDYGIYSIAVTPGEKIDFSFIGYKGQSYQIPQNVQGEMLQFSPVLQQDTAYLPTAIVRPIPLPATLKRMFLDLPLVDDHYAIARENLNLQRMLQEMRYLPMDAQSIRNMHVRQDIQNGAMRGMVPSTGLFNPLSWYEFIRSLKEGGN